MTVRFRSELRGAAANITAAPPTRRPRRLRPEVQEIRRRVALALSQFRATTRATQEDIAVAMGVAQSTVARWEAGKAEPRGPQVAELAHHMGLPAEALLGIGSDASMRPGQPIPFEGWLGEPGLRAAPREPLVVPAWIGVGGERGLGFFLAGKRALHAVANEVVIVRALQGLQDIRPNALLVLRRDWVDEGGERHGAAKLLLTDSPAVLRRAERLAVEEGGDARDGWRIAHRVIWRIAPVP